METSATVLTSGGIDSAACISLLIDCGYKVSGLFIDYKQPCRIAERRAARAVARHFRIRLGVGAFSGHVTVANGEIPGRNAWLLMSSLMLVGYRTDALCIGVHSGTDYYDCSPSFISLARRIVGEYSDGRVSVLAPLTSWSKRDVIEYLTDKNFPFRLTHSCQTADEPCGHCRSCMDRMALGC